MPDLPQKKVGIVACSGEELPEGTVSRLAALRILEDLRPAETVTICLPLFLAGGEGDRAFARFYPTVTIDGCQEKCAARATERYSGKPAASLVVSEIRARAGLDLPQGRRQLNQAGEAAVTATAAQVATIVDELLAARWSRREGKVVPEENLGATATELEPDISPCACGSGIPVQKVKIHGQVVSLVALQPCLKNGGSRRRPQIPT